VTSHLPTLRTARLVLRPLETTDAPAIQRLAGEREIALNTLVIPHPYPDGVAEAWIEEQKQQGELDRMYNFAIDDGGLIGIAGLTMKGERIAELGYWIGVPFWGRGYASEAAAEVIRFGFEDCGMHRIFACHYARNPASGRILQKVAMTREGTLRQHILKWGEFLDVVYYGLLREEWEAAAPVSRTASSTARQNE
jgi:[ribosomal protein S5]-alanine N-acetyltransferase